MGRITLYAKEDDADVWDAARDLSKSSGESLSNLVVEGLRSVLADRQRARRSGWQVSIGPKSNRRMFVLNEEELSAGAVAALVRSARHTVESAEKAAGKARDEVARIGVSRKGQTGPV